MRVPPYLMRYVASKILNYSNLTYLQRNDRSSLKTLISSSATNFYNVLRTSSNLHYAVLDQHVLKVNKINECFSGIQSEDFDKSETVTCAEIVPYANKNNLTTHRIAEVIDQDDLPQFLKAKGFLLTEDFKNILSRTSFHYDMNLTNHQIMQHLVLTTASTTLSIASHGLYHLPNAYLDKTIFVQNVNLCEKFKYQNDSGNVEQTGRPSEEQLLNVINNLCDSLMNFFEKPQDYSIYDKNMLFQNNFKGITTRGISAYSQQMYILKLFGHLHYAKVKVEILKITHHTEDGTVRVRWRVNGVSRHKVLLQFWKFKSSSWKQFLEQESEWIDGFSVFSVNHSGLIFKHVCDKMMPDNEELAAKNVSLRTRLLKLFGLSLGPSALSAIVMRGVGACPLSLQAIDNLKMYSKTTK